MTIKIITNEAKVEYLTKNKQQTLLADQGVLYIRRGSNKFGQLTRSTYTGMTPQEAVEKRYTNRSGESKDQYIDAIIVFDKTEGDNFQYDDKIREMISTLHRKDKISFDALYPGYQIDNTNEESLLQFDFNRDFDTVLNITKQYFGFNNQFNTNESFIPRFGQDTAISESVHKLTTLKQALLAAYTAFGKTITSIEIAHQVIPNGGIVLVTTPVVDTINGFKDELHPLTGKRFGSNFNRKSSVITAKDFLEFDGNPKQFINSLKKRKKDGELLFVLLSVQDLRYQNKSTELSKDQRKNIRKKYKKLNKNIDLWIRDERHKEYEGEITSQTFGSFESDMNLDLTATPYKIASRYDEKHIVNRSLSWAMLNRKDTKIPTIKIDILHSAFDTLPKSLQKIYNQEEGWNPKKFFEAVKQENEQLSFTQIQGIRDLYNSLYVDNKSKKKNPLSISNDTTISEVSKKVGMWVLPHGSADIPAKEYLKDLANQLNSENSKNLILDSDTLEKNFKSKQKHYKTIGNYLEELASTYDKVTILTCEKFLTGTNIPNLGHIVLLTSIRDISKFEQLIGRMVRTYKDKDVVKLYSYCPGIEIQNTLAEWAVQSSNLNPSIEPEEFLDCISITEYVLGGSNPVSVENIIKVYQENMKNISSAPIDLITNEISTQGLAGYWNDIKLLKKGKGPTVTVSEDNGSKVKNPKEKDNSVPTANANIKNNSVAENIGIILKESIPFAYSHNIWTVVDILQLPELALLIDAVNLNALINAVEQSPELKSLIQNWFKKVEMSIRQLPLEKVYEKIFVNSQLKAKNGLVYVPWKLAEEIINELKINKYDKVLVPNALNGVIPLILRDKYPDLEIVCAEIFDYFIPHLKRLGFEVIQWKQLETEMGKKFDVVVGNPPYQDGNKLGQQNKIYNQICKQALLLLKDDGCIAFITPTSVLKHSKRFSVIGQPGLKYVDFNANNYFTVGINICSWVIDKTYNGDVNVTHGKTMSTQESGEPVYNFATDDEEFIKLYKALKEITNTPDSRMFQQNNFGPAMSKESIYPYKLYKINNNTPLLTFYTKRLPYHYGRKKFIISRTKGFNNNATTISTSDFDVAHMFTDIKDKNEAANIKSFLFSDYFKEHSQKWKNLDGYGFNDSLIYLPPFDKTKSWTNDKVKEFLEGFVKADVK